MLSEDQSSRSADSGFDSTGPYFSTRRKIGFVLGVPLCLLLLWPALTPGLGAEARRLLAVAVLMAFWWITEALPMPVTALLPMALFPMMNIMSMAEVTRNYGDEILFLFLGGFFIAMAMQKWNLHRRLALHIVHLVGASPSRIVLGFMCATAFISMWISNTATAMMMYPIALAVTAQLAEQGGAPISEQSRGFRTCLMLGVAYAANIGGMGTLLGTAPNLVFASNARKLFPEAPTVDFLGWAGFGVPIVLLFIPITWILMTRFLFPLGRAESVAATDVITDELRKLGRMSRGELYTLIVFVLAALAWVFRADIDFGVFRLSGWASRLGVESFVSDSTVAMVAAIVLFLIPVHWRRGQFVLDWETAVKIPWGILLFFGGGLALSAGFKTTGLSEWIGERMTLLSGVPPLLMVGIVCFVITFVTEVTSNTATATIFMPIAAATAQAMQMNPFLLMTAVAISASCSFMLPVATAPNAIVFASGHVTVPQMAKTGFWLNLIGVVLVTSVIYLFAVRSLNIDLGQMPAWAR